MANIILRKKGEARTVKTTPAPTAVTIGPRTRAEIKNFQRQNAKETFRAINALFSNTSLRSFQKASAF